jgi:hypothetical protein
MPGLAFLFWLGEQPLSIHAVVTPEDPTPVGDQLLPSFHPILQGLSHFDWRLIR